MYQLPGHCPGRPRPAGTYGSGTKPCRPAFSDQSPHFYYDVHIEQTCTHVLVPSKFCIHDSMTLYNCRITRNLTEIHHEYKVLTHGYKNI